MEQWEHMIVQAELTTEAQQLFAYTVAGDKKLLGDEPPSNGRILQVLNELGREGWHLADYDQKTSSLGAIGTYFLRRRLD